MPAFATHEIFGEDGVGEALSPELTRAVSRHREVFSMGCQGPDLFFYNPFLSAGGKNVNLGSRMHETRMNRFFQAYLEELLRIGDRLGMETGVSYWLGFLSHYVLDTELHPYVYSRVGYIAGEEDSSGKTLPLHHRLEAVIDKQMLMAKKECMPSCYYPERRIRISDQELSVVAGLLSRAVQRVYGVLLKPRHVRESYRWMRFVVKRVYEHSAKGGQGRRTFSPVRCLPLIGNMTVSDELEDTLDAMNRRGEPWIHPWQRDRISRVSVWELYDNALERYQRYGRNIEPVLTGMLKRMTLLEKKQSRAECVREALAQQIPAAVKTLENRNYHSNQLIGLEREHGDGERERMEDIW